MISYGCILAFFFVYYILGYLPRKVKGGKALGWNQETKRNDKTITGVCKNNLVTEDEFAYVLKLLSSFGLAEAIPESLMDAVVSVSGSSPAYVFLFIEAMADAAVADGMPRAQAYKFAAQAVLGSAKMVLETGKHPAELKDMVCSPAGTTIQAVRVLEEKGLRSAVFEAQTACVNKAKGM